MGSQGLRYILGEFFSQQFTTVPELPNVSLEGKTVCITGATSGLGFEAAKILAKLGPAKLIVTGRTAAKYDPVVAEIRKTTGFENVVGYALDLTSFASVRQFVAHVEREDKRLDVLYLNAGMQSPPTRTTWTDDGHEITNQVNVLSTFLVALLLAPLLASSGSASSPSQLVVTASDTHTVVTALPKTGVLRAMDDKERTAAAGKSKDKGEQFLGVSSRYPVSKTAEILIVQALARRLPDSLVVTTVNPGLCHSELARNFDGALSFVFGIFKNLLARTTEQGARCIVAPGLSARHSGKYWSTCREYPVAPFTASADGLAIGENMLEELLDILRPVDGNVGRALR